MIKKIKKGDYAIEFDDTSGYSKEQLDKIVNKAIRFADARIKKEEQVEDIKIEDKPSKAEIDNCVEMAQVLKRMHPNMLTKDIIEKTLEIAGINKANHDEKQMGDIGVEIANIIDGNGEDTQEANAKDGPVNSPEETVSITYNEKLKGGKNALTYGMIEEAFKQRGKDEGKTFEAYLDVALDSLKEDIANAKYIVSGEMKPVRSLLLEDYVKIEHLAKKAGMTKKVEEMAPLVDELSEKLNLDYWKKPEFKLKERKKASKELRAKHRFDSHIEKKMEPVFLCSPADLKASYMDAKQGKLPKVFEGNLRKMEKDIEADYDRINQGRDTYLEDPRIEKLLPKIVEHYQNAIQYAEELGYKEIATRFAFMLNTIKKGWGLE